MEDKQKICELLLPALQATRCLSDLVALEYQKLDSGGEVVKARFRSGGQKKACVSMDSGIAMIQDIIRQIT